MPNLDPYRKGRALDLIEMLTHFSSSSLAYERHLLETKWFDYRFMSPVAATKLFLSKYQEIFRRKFRQELDMERAGSVSGVDLKRFENDARERTQLWVARQRADALGMRYDEYIEAAFDFGSRRKRKFFPRPNQLHGGEASIEALQAFRAEFWEDRLSSGAVVVDGHEYRVETYRGLPAQDAYRSFILERAKAACRPWGQLMEIYCVQRRQVPVETFAPLMSAETFERERAYAGRAGRFTPEPVPEHTSATLWQSCFGVPGARDPYSAPCSGCPQSAGCEGLSQRITRLVEQRCGTRFPADDRQRAAARDRKRRQRQREKENAGAQPQAAAHRTPPEARSQQSR